MNVPKYGFSCPCSFQNDSEISTMDLSPKLIIFFSDLVPIKFERRILFYILISSATLDEFPVLLFLLMSFLSFVFLLSSSQNPGCRCRVSRRPFLHPAILSGLHGWTGALSPPTRMRAGGSPLSCRGTHVSYTLSICISVVSTSAGGQKAPRRDHKE